MTRKTITVTEAVYDHLADLKRDDESWSEFGERIANELEADGSQDKDGDEGPNTVPDIERPLTEDHIDDIAAEVERRVERSLENLGTRR